MATINKYTFNKADTIVPVALTGTDDVTLVPSKTSVLIVENASVGNVTINLLGDGVTTKVCQGIGDVDLSGGLDFVVTASSTMKFQLNPFHAAYMGDALVNITGGTADLTAYVLES